MHQQIAVQMKHPRLQFNGSMQDCNISIANGTAVFHDAVELIHTCGQTQVLWYLVWFSAS